MVKKTLPLFVLLFTITNSFSQNKKILYGTVKDSLDVIYNAHVVNVNSKLGTTTTTDGTFKIHVSIGDTLLISSIQYLEKKYIVLKKSFSFNGLIIYLQPKTYELDEFDLKKHNLIGSLDSDINTVPKQYGENISATSLGLPNAGQKKMSKIDREIYAATGAPLDLLLSVLSGRLKKLKKKKKIIEEDTDVYLMHSKVKYFLTQNFNIKEEDIFRFLYFCRSDSLFTKTILKDEFALIKFMQQKSYEFNEI